MYLSIYDRTLSLCPVFFSQEDQHLPSSGRVGRCSVGPMLLTVLWLVGSLLNTLLLVQGGVDQGVPVRGAENWQPEQEEECRIMGALSGLQRKIVGATAQLDEIDMEAGASSRTKQVLLLQTPSYRCHLSVLRSGTHTVKHLFGRAAPPSTCTCIA